MTPTMINVVYNEDCRETMKRMNDKSINMVMCSPPYWALRDYGTGDNQLGLEPTFDLYIKHLCDIFDEVKRVLRDDGVIFVNMGDTYGGSWQNYGSREGGQRKKNTKSYERGNSPSQRIPPSVYVSQKSLTMIPFRFAIAMVNRGWILRNTIIWHKRNCMPSSTKDRFTVDFEYLFFFSKKKKYYFEQQLESQLDSSIYRMQYDFEGRPGEAYPNEKRQNPFPATWTPNLEGRNKRTVWTINPKPFSEAHFAVYPEELCETPIKAGCPEFVCKKCGEPRKQIRTITKSKNAFNIRVRDVKEGRIKHTDRVASKEETDNYDEKEYSPTFDHIISDGCDCNAGFEGGIVYDPFAGSGTTGLVAHRLNRNYILSEMKKEYCEIAEKRLSITKQIQFA